MKFQGGQTLLYQKGQALLIVLLSMAVILVIVLSVLSRSVTDVVITSREEEALRAFSAAEAGIEQALVSLTATSGDFEGASFDAQIAPVISPNGKTFVSPEDVAAGETVTLWFVSHDEDGNLICDATNPCFTGARMRVCWGKPGTPVDATTTPAIEVSVLYANTPGNYSTVRVGRAAYDPNTSRASQNGFEAPDVGGCTIDGQDFAFQKLVHFFAATGVPSSVYTTPDGLQLARVRVFYNSDTPQSVGISANFGANSVLPSQGRRVESVGTAGEATRKIEVYDLFADLPGPFDSVLFSTGSIRQ